MPRPKLIPTNAQRTKAKGLASVGLPHDQIARQIGLRSPKTLRKYYGLELEEGRFNCAIEVRAAKYKQATDGKHLKLTTDWLEAAGWSRAKNRPQPGSEKPKQPIIHVVFIPDDEYDFEREEPKVLTKLRSESPIPRRLVRAVTQPHFNSPEEGRNMVRTLAMLQFRAEEIAPRVGVRSLKKFRAEYGKDFQEGKHDGNWRVLQTLRTMATSGRNSAATLYMEERVLGPPPRTEAMPDLQKPIVIYLPWNTRMPCGRSDSNGTPKPGGSVVSATRGRR